MTLHVHYDHTCVCGAEYIPYDKVQCPNCGRFEPARFDFVPQAAHSAIANFDKYGTFMPAGWAIMTLAHSLLLQVFRVLDFHTQSRNSSISASAIAYFERVDFRGRPYMLNYLVDLSERVHGRISVKLSDDDIKNRQCRDWAHISTQIDWERRELPASPVKAKLRESKIRPQQQSDGTWLVYMLGDRRGVLYRAETSAYLLVNADGSRQFFKSVTGLVDYLAKNQDSGARP